MRLRDTVRVAIKALTVNYARSLLTMLGIIIGVASIVLVISLGQAAQRLILQQVEGVGGNTVVVRPGKQPEGPSDFAGALLSDSLTTQDVAALRKSANVPDVIAVEPAVLISSSVSHGNNVSRPTVFGWNAEALGDFFQIQPIAGDFFTEDDIRAVAKVAVIGDKVREELFGEEEALGQTIRIKNISFRVVGVLPKSGQVSLLNPDELVVIPHTTAQKNILGINHFHEIILQAADPTLVDEVSENIEITLRERHGITDPEQDDFFVETQQDVVDRLRVITQSLTFFLAAIAAISLVVGGVGIMNIMLVSVTERTREIGLRKAVGARNRDIMQQFLFEALLLTLTGGAIGTILSVSLAAAIATVVSQQLNVAWPFILPIPAIIGGIVMAASIGLVFGLYPAIKAARKNPIEALRYE